MSTLKMRLDAEVAARNIQSELCQEKPDPLMMARHFGDECNALTCALFAYGNVQAILGLLSSFEGGWIDLPEESIHDAVGKRYYRFQTSEDIAQWFLALGRLKRLGGVEQRFEDGYNNGGGVIGGINTVIETLYDINPYRSQGYTFLIGKPIKRISTASAMKRWMMYLRWMVRHDALDMGLWKVMPPSELIMPLDTHSFNVSKKLGLLQRNQCDLRAALELTEKLRTYDPDDPVKYDFALYRIGQERIEL